MPSYETEMIKADGGWGANPFVQADIIIISDNFLNKKVKSRCILLDTGVQPFGQMSSKEKQVLAHFPSYPSLSIFACSSPVSFAPRFISK